MKVHKTKSDKCLINQLHQNSTKSSQAGHCGGYRSASHHPWGKGVCVQAAVSCADLSSTVLQQLREPGCRGAVRRLSQPERVPPEHGSPVTGQRATDFASSGCQEMKMCRRGSLPSLRLLWAAETVYMLNEAPGFVDKGSRDPGSKRLYVSWPVILGQGTWGRIEGRLKRNKTGWKAHLTQWESRCQAMSAHIFSRSPPSQGSD